MTRRRQLMFPAARRWPRQGAQHQHDHLDGMDDLTPAQAAFWRGRFCCVDCGRCTLYGGEYYMVRDKLWVASGLGPDDGMLCLCASAGASVAR
jgi:hypothetical protein